MSDPEISIVIVSWNVRDLTLSCLESIDRFVRTSHEVIVVDNHSHDGTVEVIQQRFPGIQVIANSENFGFARANNQGWQRSKGRYIVFLNPDTEFIDDPFPVLINRAQQTGVGCVGPQLLNPDRTYQSSVRRFPRFADQVLVLLKLGRVAKFIPALRAYQLPVRTSDVQRVEQIMGAAMVLPRTVLTELGCFDEGYWIWFEEVDLCRRLHQHGYAIEYVPDGKIIHHGGPSFAQHYSVVKHVWFMKSLARYVGKYWSPVPRLLLYLLMPISYILTVGLSLIKPK